MVRVLDQDPGLGHHLRGRALEFARAAAIAPMTALEPGLTTFSIAEPAIPGHLGMLVLNGLLARRVAFGEIGSAEFLGPGDLLRPWSRQGKPSEVVQLHWQVLVSTQLAVLDREFADRVRPWPELTGALLDRAVERTDFQVLQSALRQAKRVEDRVLLALWHFAGRWGDASAASRSVRLPNITGELLAQIVGARRQSVSSALGQLQDRGVLRRREDGSWVIPRRPPQLDYVQTGRRVTDRPPPPIQEVLAAPQ
jgi:DNA-binding transcriptional ArsR family regulator